MSRSIVSDSHTSVYAGANAGTGNAAAVDDISIIYNLLGRGTNRLPSVNGDGETEIINNVIHQWSTKLSIVSGKQKTNHIGNYYQQAPFPGKPAARDLMQDYRAGCRRAHG